MAVQDELSKGPRFDQNAQWQVRAALFDVDNTLVGNEVIDLPTERFKEAVEAARGTIKVAIASARPLSKTQHIMKYISAEGLSILCNGAQIVDSKDGAIVAEWPIEIEASIAIAKHLRQLGVDFWINDDGIDYFPAAMAGEAYEHQSDIWDKGSSRVGVPNYRPSKPFVIVSHDVTDKQVRAIENIVERQKDANITTLISHETVQSDGSKLYDLFVVHKLANKKDALAELVRLQQLELDNVMAVGDGRNDAVLVGSAGIGVAMGNSAEETLAVATFIAPRREEDGAAVALEYASKNFVSY